MPAPSSPGSGPAHRGRRDDLSRRIEAVKERCSVYDVASRFTTLEQPRSSSRTVRGLCPLHNERTPSFYVYLHKGNWFCFGCQTYGDVITLVEKCLHVSFLEALEWLEDIAGGRPQSPLYRGRPIDLPVPAGSQRDENTARARLTTAGKAALSVATTVYAQALWDSPHAQQYLASRHISEDLAVRSRLGYATGHQLVEALDRQRVPLEAAFQLGLLYGPATNPVEHFRERLVIPEVRNGQPVWITGRLIPTPDLQANQLRSTWDPRLLSLATSPKPAVMEQDHKYLNLPGPRVLGGAHTVAGQLAVVVTEGPFDWLTLVKWSFPACYIGGGGMPAELLDWIASARIVYLALDPDEAGIKLAYALRRRIGERACTVDLPHGVDPADLGTIPDGYTTFQHCLRHAALRRNGT
jgi:DNA primase